MLGTMAGLWLSFLLFFVVLFAGLAAYLAKSLGSADTDTTPKHILYIDLSGSIPERAPELSLQDLMNIENIGTETFSDILTALSLAAKDKEIHGIVINCGGSELGMASRGELVEALKKFKEESDGKWILAYADNYTQGDYYVASVADEINLNPIGSVDIHGLASNTLFFKNLLDKIGVEMQVVKVGSYKSAVEPFIRTDMSAPSREQTTVFLSQIWKHIAGQIADNRSTDLKDVNDWADSLSMTWDATTYVDLGIVDWLRYRADFDDFIREKENLDATDKLPYVTPAKYLSSDKLAELGEMSKKHIAVYYAIGDIVDSGDGGIVGSKVVSDINKLRDDENVLGMVLRVNSGGGSAFASEQIWYAVCSFQSTGKPVYVSMGDYAASGGYYISCSADSIFADPATLTGSIGIFGLIPNAHKLLTDKIGISFDLVETNPGANIPVGYKPMSPRQYAAMQSYVERGYDLFTSRVAEGRNIPQDSVKAIGGGRVWDGMSALKIGLVDTIGGLNNALSALADKLGIDADKYVAYPTTEEKWYDALINSGLVKVNIDGSEMAFSAEYARYAFLAKYLKNLNPLQARMEPMLIK